MKRSVPLTALGGALVLAAFLACGVDDRSLTYSYRALGTGGTSASSGAGSSAPAESGGNAGAADGAESGAGNNASGGTQGRAGSASANGGDSSGGAAAGGATSGGAAAGGATTGGGASGGAATGGSAVTSVAGSAGSTVAYPCGDLNEDAVDDCSQTLVQNSRFDSAVSGWEAEPPSTQAWNATNATSKTGSGSLTLSYAAAVVQAVGATAVGSRQCIPATPDTNYDVAARVSLAAGQTGGQGGIVVWLFDDDACQGNVITGAQPIAGGEAGKWSALSGKLWVPGGVHSMYVRLVAIKPFAQAQLTVLIDDVLVAKR